MTLPSIARAALVPCLAVMTALLMGAVIILGAGGDALLAYRGLWEGSLGRPEAISESLAWSTPYILGGLAVALAFRAGLFNIGAEGQIGDGALCAVYVGYAATWLPGPLHLIAAIGAGIAGGAAWGFLPGVLKARTGAHEVITTIMLNYVAIQVTSWLLAGTMKDPSPFIAMAQTPKILESARFPILVEGYRLHRGFVLAIVAAIAVWLYLRSTTGWGKLSGCALCRYLRRGHDSSRNVALGSACRASRNHRGCGAESLPHPWIQRRVRG